jgi:hypothetical protein
VPHTNPIPEIQNAFDYATMIPTPTSTALSMIPPVSCVIIPNDENDVNSLVAAPFTERMDLAGRMPIRIQLDFTRHVDDVIHHKPSLIDIAGEPFNNWAQFTKTRRSFPTQVTAN